MNDLHYKEILKICDGRNLHVNEHDNESRKYLKLPVAHYNMHSHYVMNNEGEIIFSGSPTMIHSFLTKEE